MLLLMPYDFAMPAFAAIDFRYAIAFRCRCRRLFILER